MAVCSMSIIDKRLYPEDAAAGASAPNLATNNFQVDKTVKLVDAFTWVKTFASAQKSGKIDIFNILCHGYYNWAESEELQSSTMVGGFGLELCKEGLLPGTVNSIVPLVKDRFVEVFIYACGAGSSQAGGSQNGGTFCASLAVKLNCVVYASDRKQVFNYSRTAAAALNFGEWEGTVTRYTPDGRTFPVGKFHSPNPT